jgi:hypothetical protein
MGDKNMLVVIKVAHTVIWAIMAGSIVALPVTAWRRRFGWAAILSALILVECVVLALNGGRCPLTDWAARYTRERGAAFDIYLPNWLARYNKVIFGSLFIAGEGFVVWKWRMAKVEDADGHAFTHASQNRA